MGDEPRPGGRVGATGVGPTRTGDAGPPDPEAGDDVPAGSDDDAVIDAEIVDDTPDGPDGPEVTEIIDIFDADPLDVALSERDEYLDALRRLQAEFENYKKRVGKQQSEQAARATASLVGELLPVLDALDLAADHIGDSDSEDARALVAAAGLLHGILAKEGLERIDPMGEPFDPNSHQAVGQVPASDGEDDPDGADGTPDAGDLHAHEGPVVAQVMRAGYRWHGTVVRAAMVLVRD